MQELAYRAKDAAKVIGIGLTQMQKMIRCGDIKVVQIGPRMTLIPRVEIERYLNENLATKYSVEGR